MGQKACEIRLGRDSDAVKDTHPRIQQVPRGAEFPFLQYLPTGYKENGKCPLILFLHGKGERGKSLGALENFGPYAYIRDGHELPFAVIAPLLEADRHWVEDETGKDSDREISRLRRFIRQILMMHSFDPGRIYLTGLSMGGRGAYKLACAIPDTFAALAVCCGRPFAREDMTVPLYPLEQIRYIPVWLFHGLEDKIVDPAHTLSAMRTLLEQNPERNLRMTLYPGQEHDSYEQAFREPRLYGWLEQQKREREHA